MMGNLNKRTKEEVVISNDESCDESKTKTFGWIGKVSYVMSGAVFSKEAVVKSFPFILYVVFLLMLYIGNIYVAEDISREISRFNRLSEERYVEYIYLKSEVTSITKQSNLARMLKNTGIKESVDPFKKIVVQKEGGEDDRS